MATTVDWYGNILDDRGVAVGKIDYADSPMGKAAIAKNDELQAATASNREATDAYERNPSAATTSLLALANAKTTAALNSYTAVERYVPPTPAPAVRLTTDNLVDLAQGVKAGTAPPLLKSNGATSGSMKKPIAIGVAVVVGVIVLSLV